MQVTKDPKDYFNLDLSETLEVCVCVVVKPVKMNLFVGEPVHEECPGHVQEAVVEPAGGECKANISMGKCCGFGQIMWLWL